MLRVRDKAIVLQTMLWPDEVREPEFDILDADVELRPQELTMAASLVESLGADFDPSQFHDEYRDAVGELIERKRTTGETRPAPVAEKPADEGDSMTDLLSALQASVEAARAGSGERRRGAAPPASRRSPAAATRRTPPRPRKPASVASGADGHRQTSSRKQSARPRRQPGRQAQPPARRPGRPAPRPR